MKTPNQSQTGEIVRLTKKSNKHATAILSNSVTHSLPTPSTTSPASATPLGSPTSPQHNLKKFKAEQSALS
jgi:hypothetical protein